MERGPAGIDVPGRRQSEEHPIVRPLPAEPATSNAPSADARVLDQLESIIVEAIGVTTASLGDVPSGSQLTLQQWRALILLGVADGIRVGALAEQLGTSMPTASRIVARLERRGLVAVEPDDHDHRAVLVRASAAGSRLRAEIVARRRAWLRRALAGGDPLPADATEVLALVARLLARATTERGAAGRPDSG